MIWCVEDDASIRDIEVYALQSTGFEARGFEDGTSFWDALQGAVLPELVVLDVMLPGVDGVELLRRIRADARMAAIPVVMATARGAEYDKIQGLDLGADYYLPKAVEHLLKTGGLFVNLDEHTVSADGARVELTYKEFELLKLFLSHPGVAWTREKLMEQVWGTDYCGETRTVDMHIRTLRQKLGSYGDRIETVRGVGYRWEAQT